MVCPICHGKNIFPSKRRIFEIPFAFLLLISPYRCKDCWNRFRVWRIPFKNKKANIIFLILGLSFIVSPFVIQSQNYFMKNDVQSEKPDIDPSAIAKSNNISESRKNVVITDNGQESPKKEQNIEEADRKAENDEICEDSQKNSSNSQNADKNMQQTDSGESQKTQPISKTVPIISEQKAVQNKDEETRRDNSNKKPADKDQKTSKATEDNLKSEASKRKGTNLQLTGIDTDSAKDSLQIAIKANGPIGEYKYFFISDNGILKLIIDVEGSWNNLKNMTYNLEDEIVKCIRTADHSDKLRIVFDLKTTQKPNVLFSTESDKLLITLDKNKVIRS